MNEGSADEPMPNPASNKEKAEGSRENVNIDTGEHASGISNRPLAEERERQAQVPERGGRKEGSHA